MYTYIFTKCNICECSISLKLNGMKTFLAVPPKIRFIFDSSFSLLVDRKSSRKSKLSRNVIFMLLKNIFL